VSFKSRVFGQLTILKEIKTDIFLCRCSCGNEIEVWRSLLTNDVQRHCGCLPVVYSFHGHMRCSWSRDGRTIRRYSAEYNSFSAMKTRCLNRNSSEYHNYGGRGIRICERWLLPKCEGFKNFIEVMGPRPSGKTLDRIDPQGHYCPQNCRWADTDTQHRNQRRFLYPDGDVPPVESYRVMEQRLEAEYEEAHPY